VSESYLQGHPKLLHIHFLPVGSLQLSDHFALGADLKKKNKKENKIKNSSMKRILSTK
jgi:hypothetical protein